MRVVSLWMTLIFLVVLTCAELLPDTLLLFNQLTLGWTHYTPYSYPWTLAHTLALTRGFAWVGFAISLATHLVIINSRKPVEPWDRQQS